MAPEEITAENIGTRVLVLGDPAQLPPVKGTGYFITASPESLLTEVHRQAAGSPIIALANGTPIIHTYSEFHSPKCWMFKDIGRGEWLLEMDDTSADKMAETLFAIDADYAAAQAKVKKAMAYVNECFGKSMQQVKGILGTA